MRIVDLLLQCPDRAASMLLGQKSLDLDHAPSEMLYPQEETMAAGL